MWYFHCVNSKITPFILNQLKLINKDWRSYYHLHCKDTTILKRRATVWILQISMVPVAFPFFMYWFWKDQLFQSICESCKTKHKIIHLLGELDEDKISIRKRRMLYSVIHWKTYFLFIHCQQIVNFGNKFTIVYNNSCNLARIWTCIYLFIFELTWKTLV